MKSPILFIMLLCSCYNFAQQQTTMSTINDQIEIINSYMESDIFFLDPEEFLSQAADHGAELKGYYEHGRLKKIVRKVGMPTTMEVTVFYFWNDQLIHVVYMQQSYPNTKNDLGQTIKDYDNPITKYNAKYYFNNGKVVKKDIKGTPIKDMKLTREFVRYSTRMKKLLDNKYMNKHTYEMLQGRWENLIMPGEDVLFQETIKISFREGRYFKKQKVKINDGIMYCSSPKDKYVYKYKIHSLSYTDLMLEDLQNPSADLFMYKKVTE